MSFDYALEPRRDILCIDLKSFYASVECVDRGLHPLRTMLVVMSHADNTGGLVLASSPAAKQHLGVSNVTRKYDVPEHPDLVIVPPRMTVYIDRNLLINNIYRRYVPDEFLHIYSIDESFLDITGSLTLFDKTPYQLAQKIQEDVQTETGLYCTIGIGDNPLLAKLALDNAAKNSPDMIAEWRYEKVPETVWKINDLADMWGIGQRTKRRLNMMGIESVYDLAHYDYYRLSERLGVIGTQLYANSWGIDRAKLNEPCKPLEKSYGNSQVLMKDYTSQREIEIVIREMAEQVATRIRRHGCQTRCVSLSIGFSRGESERGFSLQMQIPQTNHSKKLVQQCLTLFRKRYRGEAVRNIAIAYSKLVYTENIQLDLFEDAQAQITSGNLDKAVDFVRSKYGFKSIFHASSLEDGATAIARSSLVGGHAGGNDGLE